MCFWTGGHDAQKKIDELNQMLKQLKEQAAADERHFQTEMVSYQMIVQSVPLQFENFLLRIHKQPEADCNDTIFMSL